MCNTYTTKFIAWIGFLVMLENNLEITNVNVLLCFIASIYLSMAQCHWQLLQCTGNINFARFNVIILHRNCSYFIIIRRLQNACDAPLE